MALFLFVVIGRWCGLWFVVAPVGCCLLSQRPSVCLCVCRCLSLFVVRCRLFVVVNLLLCGLLGWL